MPGTRLDRRFITLDGLFELARPHVEVAGVVEKVGIPRIEGQQAFVYRFGFGDVPGRFGAERLLFIAAVGDRLAPDLGEERVARRDRTRQLAGGRRRPPRRFIVPLPGVEARERRLDRPGPGCERGGPLKMSTGRGKFVALHEELPDSELGGGRVRGRVAGSAVAVESQVGASGAFEEFGRQQMDRRVAGMEMQDTVDCLQGVVRTNVLQRGGAQVRPAEVRRVEVFSLGVTCLRLFFQAVRLKRLPEGAPGLRGARILRDQQAMPGDLLLDPWLHGRGLRVRNADRGRRLGERPGGRQDAQGGGRKPAPQRGAPPSVEPTVIVRWCRPARFAQASTVTSIRPSPRTVQEIVFRDSSAPDPQRRM